MISFFKKKGNLLPILQKEVLERIQRESNDQQKDQVLLVRLVHNEKGVGEVQISFSDQLTSDKNPIRFMDPNSAELLQYGEFHYEMGKIFFYPNVDLIWSNTPKKEIHKITSNYEFSKTKLYFESNDFGVFRSELETCFKNEKVKSVFMDKNLCQLEIEVLDEAKEIRISEVFLTFFSSFYSSPLKAQHHLL